MNNQEYLSNLTIFQNSIGYKYHNEEYLKLALTHSSYANEVKARGEDCECNERLEFLGDSVLSFVVSEYLYLIFPDLPEGDLSRIRSNTVCEKALFEFAKKIDIGDYLLLGKGEEKERNSGISKPSILADAFEALLASIFLDGGITPVKSFLMPLIKSEIGAQIKSGNFQDYKTLLQQFVQQDQQEHLCYVTVGESGPDHQRIFEVEARLNNTVVGRGKGFTKREAEQNAAKESLELFGVQ